MSERGAAAFKARYFTDRNIYPSRILTGQGVDTLLINAAADALPGVLSTRLTTVRQTLTNYVSTNDPQTDATKLRELRDLTFEEVMHLRYEIQFAADTVYP